ncbi:MAG TPA: hypothetical protein VGR06_36800 [Actinophytocola sp.]|jgi:hypothetical protein|uniref:hypothetical protein n=1 Tax=Actinophytocola sp. TaxID=1872138 RepID=UPI002E02B1EB|nr:hypothetical protein [Actinophytocola sp.]
MRRLCVLVVVVSAVAGIGVSVPPAALADDGRWKVGESGCYWDPNDAGPDQCSPDTGRYKVGDGPVCYWENNDSGPNQCDPGQQTPAETIPEDQPIPYTDDSSSIQRSFTGPGSPPGVSCENFTQVGANGIARISVNVTPDGTLHYSMGMPHFWENYGLWIVDTWVNGRHLRSHPLTPLPPSGSEPRSVVPSGSEFFIQAIHYFLYFEIFWVSAPECLVFFPICYQPVLVPLPAITISSLTCRVS